MAIVWLATTARTTWHPHEFADVSRPASVGLELLPPATALSNSPRKSISCIRIRRYLHAVSFVIACVVKLAHTCANFPGPAERKTETSKMLKFRCTRAYTFSVQGLRRRILTLSERMPPYSRHHKYSKKIECRHTGGKKKQKFPTFAGIKTQKLPFS